MRILCNRQPQIDIGESDKVEFKTSIFFSPRDHVAGSFQMETIAKTVASFMNADGGDLYIGVRDDGTVKGLAQDFEMLLSGGDAIVVRSPTYGGDDDLSYSGDADGYERKIRMIVKAYLRDFAEEFIVYHKESCEGIEYARLEVRPLPANLIAYFPGRHGADMAEEIWVRRGNAKKNLVGFARDQFVCERYKKRLMDELERVSAGSGNADEKLDAMMAVLTALQEKKVFQGKDVVITGAHPLEEEFIKPMGKPKGVVFDGAHLCDVKSWKEVFGAIYAKVNGLNPSAFDAIKENAQFAKWFKQGKRCTGCYPMKFGTNGDVRAVEVSGKQYLWNEKYFFRQFLATAGIDCSRFMIRA